MHITPIEARRMAWEGSVPEPNSGCWLWLGNIRGRGYAAFGRGGYVCRAILGLTDRHIEALHRCDNQYCVNPDHLFAGTQRANVDDMMAKGRHRRYEGPRPGGYRLATHCKHGHEFTPENTLLFTPQGKRQRRRRCRVCNQAAWRKYSERTHEQ